MRRTARLAGRLRGSGNKRWRFMILTRNHSALASLSIQPGSFAGLMDLYERNYIGIRRLIPLMPPVGSRLASPVPGGLTLHLEVLERFRYTTELSLTYHFTKANDTVAEPDLRIRVYHDARLAEVVAAQLRRGPGFSSEADGASQTQLAVRWHINRFLYKWLNYCLHQGHRFETLPRRIK
jgi:uncharacterized protein YqiB (DUF1249 family)